MKKIIFTVFSILIILTTIFFIAIGTVRDSRYYILILVYIIVYKIILSFTNRSKIFLYNNYYGFYTEKYMNN